MSTAFRFDIDTRGVEQFLEIADEKVRDRAEAIAEESKRQAPQSGSGIARKGPGYGPLVDEIGTKKGRKAGRYLVIADAFYSAFVHEGHKTRNGGETRKNDYVVRAAQIVGGK